MAKSTPEQLEARKKDRASWSPEKKAKYRADLKKWRLENPGYSAKALSAWVQANPERWAFLRWKTSIKRNYGLSFEQYQALIKLQSGRCAICGLSSDATLHVDHCHITKRGARITMPTM